MKRSRLLPALAIALTALGVGKAIDVALRADDALAADPPAQKQAAPAAARPAAPAPAAARLADEAGLSPSEYRLLNSLQQRRQELDARERTLATREGALKAAEARVVARIEELRAVETAVKAALGQLDEQENQRIAGLVAVYERMKPKDSAPIFEGLDEAIQLQVASRMKNQPLALMMAQMDPVRARRLTTLLAQRADRPVLPQTAQAAAPAAPRPAAPAPRPAAAPARAG